MGSCCVKIFGNLGYVVVPFSDLKNNWVDPLIIVVAVIWSITIESYEIVLPYGTDENSLVVGILSATLGFLLSLNLGQYLAQNKEGIGNFEAYVGQISALAWSVSTLEDPDDKRIEDNVIDNDVLVSNESDIYVQLKYKIFAILKLMPFALKHFFRGSFSLDKMEQSEKQDSFILEVISDMRELEKTGNINPIDNLMFLLMIKLKHLKGDITVIHGKWDALYGPYGAIATAAGYGTPVIFSYVLTTALAIYITMLPIGYSGHSRWNVGITFVIMYFFVGLNSAGKLVHNPFVSLPDGITIFPTASNTARGARKEIEAIEKYGERDGFIFKKKIQKSGLTFV
tara:strand:- start:439 stop:1461 length:1023 start_codon:yes stop_codon:yes gene_type:complete